MTSQNRTSHIRLTSHPEPGSAAARFPIQWGASTPQERGPVIASTTNPADRNVIGAHGGSYSVYRALAISAGAMDPQARPDLADTAPVCEIGPHPQWGEAGRIVSLDPWGHRVAIDFADLIAEGLDIRPSIAITCSDPSTDSIRRETSDTSSRNNSENSPVAPSSSPNAAGFLPSSFIA